MNFVTKIYFKVKSNTKLPIIELNESFTFNTFLFSPFMNRKTHSLKKKGKVLFCYQNFTPYLICTVYFIKQIIFKTLKYCRCLYETNQKTGNKIIRNNC